jgi:hypothetical protein
LITDHDQCSAPLIELAATLYCDSVLRLCAATHVPRLTATTLCEGLSARNSVDLSLCAGCALVELRSRRAALSSSCAVAHSLRIQQRAAFNVPCRLQCLVKRDRVCDVAIPSLISSNRPPHSGVGCSPSEASIDDVLHVPLLPASAAPPHGQAGWAALQRRTQRPAMYSALTPNSV